MAFPKVKDARALSDEELQTQIAETKKQLFELRFQKATRQLETTHNFKHQRHWLAQLMTVERERVLAVSGQDSSDQSPMSAQEQESE